MGEAERLLKLAAYLHRMSDGDERAGPELRDYYVATFCPWIQAGSIPPDVARAQRFATIYLMWGLNSMLYQAVHPVLNLDEHRGPELRLRSFTVYGLLSAQLRLVVSRNRKLAMCSICSRPYVPRRKPNPNRRNYCSEACSQEGAKLRQAASLERARGTLRSGGRRHG